MFVISGIMFILMTLNNVKARAEFIPYSQAIQHLEAENVDAMTIDKGKYIAVLKLKNGTEAKTYIPYTSFDELILKYIQPGGIKVNYIIPANNSWISTLLPLLLMVGVMVFVFYLLNQQSSGGGKVMGFGKSSAKMFTPGNKKVTFKDVAGADEEKEEMAEIVDFLKKSRKV